MKLLHVIDRLDPSLGGVCQAVRTMAPELTKQGVLNEVVSLDAPDALFLQADAFPVHALGPSTSPWKYSAQLLPWLLQHLCRFDVVIVHGLWLYHSYAVTKALVRLKQQQKAGKLNQVKIPKLFIMPHGMLDPYFQRAASRKLKAVRNWAYWKLIEARVVNSADGLLFTCEEERRLAHEPFRPYKPKQEINVGYGIVAPPAFRSTMQAAFREQCPGLGNQPYLLFLSRVHEKKGVDLLLQAYAQLAPSQAKAAVLTTVDIAESGGNMPEQANVSLPKLVIAGPGLDTPYGARLQQLVAQTAALQQGVYFPGMLTGAAKWGAFYGCEAFVLPSHQENFGIAVVEAMACGKPVLISNQVNIWREIQTAGAGLVASDTLTGTSDLLQRANSMSTEDKLRMGQYASKCFIEYFAVSPAVNRLLQAVFS